MKSLSILVLCFFVCACSNNKNYSEWRGPDRKGVFNETDLLKAWPESGPKLLWSFEGLGAGHSSVGVGTDRLFVNGMTDTTGILYCLDLFGNLLWQQAYGIEWHKNYTGSRSTPIVIDGKVYLESGLGQVFCFEASTGKILWMVDLIQSYGAVNIKWGLSESLLIDGDVVYCTPGGNEHNIIALNRHSGELIWSSPACKEPSAYCSPLLVEHNGNKLIVTMTATSALAVDAVTGEFYWRVEQNQRNKIHANTPVYDKGVIYFSSSSGKTNGGMLALELSEDGKSVKQLWRNETYTNLMGGIVLVDDFLFGSKYRSKEWYAINKDNGEVTLLTDEFSSGVIIYADGLFYCYNEKGVLALVDMGPEHFKIISQFEVPMGTDQHWAHPVIHDKKLYVRHGDALMVYNISIKE